MEALTIGSVVLVNFPFSDLSDSKLRTAIIVADAGKTDWIMCQITSTNYSDRKALLLKDENFKKGGLDRNSYIRPTKIFTGNISIIKREVGIVTVEYFHNLIDTIISLFKYNNLLSSILFIIKFLNLLLIYSFRLGIFFFFPIHFLYILNKKIKYHNDSKIQLQFL